MDRLVACEPRFFVRKFMEFVLPDDAPPPPDGLSPAFWWPGPLCARPRVSCIAIQLDLFRQRSERECAMIMLFAAYGLVLASMALCPPAPVVLKNANFRQDGAGRAASCKA